MTSDKTIHGQIHDTNSAEPQVQPMSLAALENASQPRTAPVPIARHMGKLPLEVMLDVPITLVFEVGRTDITIKQLMELCEGSFIPLRNISVDSVDVRVNDEVIAGAQAINLQQMYGIRFGEVEMITGLEEINSNG